MGRLAFRAAFVFALVAAAACASSSTVPPEQVGGAVDGGSRADSGSSGTAKTCESCAAGDPRCCVITLTPSRPRASLASPIVAPGIGKHRFTGYVVDVSAFASTTLTISGTARPSGCAARYALFPENFVFPADGLPPNLSSGGSNPGQSFSFSYRFDVGGRYVLGGEGSWGDPEGATNSIDLTIEVAVHDAGLDASDAAHDASDAAADVSDAAVVSDAAADEGG